MTLFHHETSNIDAPSGILLVNKPRGKTSFALVASLRRLLKVKKIGHAGTLDPFATGLMVMLIGKEYTKLSNQFLGSDKEYYATVCLGIETDTYDCDGKVVAENGTVPSIETLKEALNEFQGEVEQIPPMFSAKKVNGKKLYELARKGITIERKAVLITLSTELISYNYPFVKLKIECSKGTYIRSIANDLGKRLECGAHLSSLERSKSGFFRIEDSIDGKLLCEAGHSIEFVKSSLKQM